MKKYILILFFFSLINISAQEKIGFIFGTTVSSATHTTDGPKPDIKFTSGIYTGITSIFELPYEGLVLQPTLGFSQHGGRFYNVFTDDVGETVLSDYLKHTYNRLDLILDTKYNLDNFMPGLSGVFGVGMNYKLSGKIHSNLVVSSGEIFSYNQEIEFDYSTLSINDRIDLNIDFGVSYDFKIAHIELKYELWLTNLGDFNNYYTENIVPERPHIIKIGLSYFFI
tara:strand:+ start:43 stop:717 length:675 start_codon:yes stop_codon:yes gene_type:complete